VASRVLQVYTRLDPSWMENNEVIHNLSLLIGVPESELRQLQNQQEQERQEHKQKQEQHDSEEKEEEEEEPAARRGADLGVL
jgi:carbonic anhydrase/acetyltransferase-like protein (isoleucine patch superfamily)